MHLQFLPNWKILARNARTHIRHTYTKLYPSLFKSVWVRCVDDEHYGVHCREVVLPDSSSCFVATQVHCCDADTAYR